MIKGMLIKDGIPKRYNFTKTSDLELELGVINKEDLGVTDGLIIKHYAGAHDNDEKILIVYNKIHDDNAQVTGVCHTQNGIEEELYGSLFICEQNDDGSFISLDDRKYVQLLSSVVNKIFVFTR